MVIFSSNVYAQGITADINHSANVSEGVYAPLRLAEDGNGNIYVTDAFSKSISKYDVSGNFLEEINAGVLPVSIAITGLYNIYNALAASAVSLVLGISFPDIAQSLASFKLPPMHSQFYIFDDCQLVDDAYNANPESMKEALKLLQERGGQRKIAILGDMLELGNKAELYHYQLGKQAGESGIDALFVLGEFSKEVSRGAREAGTKNTFFFQDREKLKNELFSYLERGDSLLVKGSRGMKMEEIVEDLKERLCCIS